MAKYSEYDYMFSAPKISALSSKLPDDSKLVSWSSLPDVREITDRMSEAGISPVYTEGVFDAEKTLCGYLCSAYANLESFLPTPAPVQLMRTRYDAHNLKTAVKCRFLGIDPSPYFIDCGNISLGDCLSAFGTGNFSVFGDILGSAASAAADSVGSSRNARTVDVSIDTACFRRMLELCGEMNFEPARKLLEMKIDFTNILTFARISGIASEEKAAVFLNDSIAEGGKIPGGFYGKCGSISSLAEEAGRVYGTDTANLIRSSLADGTESLCRALDVMFRREARTVCGGVLLGALPVIGYIIELEYFVKNLRIIISGVASDTERDLIRERLRV